MIARLIASLTGIAAGVAVLAHAEPGASWAAVGGWGLVTVGFLCLVTTPEIQP